MPLPAALLARLAKRGIVETTDQAPDAKAGTGTEDANEEVFAEDYDDPSKPELPPEEPEIITPVAEEAAIPIQPTAQSEPIIRETTACPFRSNPYHTCNSYCKKKYGMREWEPDNKMMSKRDRMLAKYPLPEGWAEVGDPVTGRYYYWNLLTDQVSWLSPSHPKADVTQSSEQLGLIGKIGPLDSDGEQAMEADSDDDSQRSGSDTSLSDEEEMTERDKKLESRLFRNPLESHGKQKDEKKNRGKADDLDPMDPAAYSDIARGGWSDGLDLRGTAKTGVDHTAAGPLFQQRPYPSPGDILRSNQALKKKK